MAGWRRWRRRWAAARNGNAAAVVAKVCAIIPIDLFAFRTYKVANFISTNAGFVIDFCDRIKSVFANNITRARRA